MQHCIQASKRGSPAAKKKKKRKNKRNTMVSFCLGVTYVTLTKIKLTDQHHLTETHFINYKKSIHL